MANLFFNDLTISADRNVLDKIRLHVNADVLWAAKRELDAEDLTDTGTQLCCLYDTKGGRSMERIELLARRFPDAYFLLTFRNENASIYGFVEYAYG